jgi:hypothetical protein
MKPWERWSFTLLALAVAASGFLYGWMKYVGQPVDPFAVINHPWESSMLHLHVLVSPPFVLLFGMILNSHIMKKLQATGMPNRRSGLISLGTFVAMIASGYLLQVATVETWLRALVAIHVASGAIFTLAYLVHLVASHRLAQRTRLTPFREVA